MSSYEIERLLGEGANGTVHLAYQRSLGRKVALKRLSPSTDPTAGRRFLREAKLLSALSHPNVVRVYEVGEENGVPFIAMEYVEGETLSQAIQAGRALQEPEALFAQLMDALAHVHGLHIAHRDVKPANIMLDARGQLKLVDFGLVKAELEDTTALTEVGFVVGTVPYLAPEAFEGRFLGVPCDLWAAGCVYYELLTGQRAFQGETTRALIRQISYEETPPLPPGPLAAAREELVKRLLAKDPAQRFPDARSVLAALRPMLDEVPPPPEVAPVVRRLPTRGAALTLLVLTGLGLAAFAGLRPAPPVAPRVDPLAGVLATLRLHEEHRQQWEERAGTIKPDLYSFDFKRIERGRALCQQLVDEVGARHAELAPLHAQVPVGPAPANALLRSSLAARALMLELKIDRMSQTVGVFDVVLREKLDSLFGMGKLLQLDDQVQYDPRHLATIQSYFDISKQALQSAARAPAGAETALGLALADQFFLGRQWNPYRFRGPIQEQFQTAAAAYLVALDDADTPAVPLGTCAIRLFSLTFRGERLRDPKAVQEVLSSIDRLAISLPAARAELDFVAAHVRSLSATR